MNTEMINEASVAALKVTKDQLYTVMENIMENGGDRTILRAATMEAASHNFAAILAAKAAGEVMDKAVQVQQQIADKISAE